MGESAKHIDENMNRHGEAEMEQSLEDSQTVDEKLSHRRSSTGSQILTKKQKILRIAALLFSQVCVLSGYSMISPFFPQEAKSVGLTQTEVGVIFSIFAAVTFVMSPIYGVAIVRLGPKFMCVAGCFLCGGASLLFGLLNYIPEKDVFFVLALLIRVAEGNGSAMLSVASATMILESFESATGLMYSLIEMSVAVGYIGGPAFGAAFYAIGGYSLPFMVVGGLTLAMSFILLLVLTNEKAEAQAANFLALLKIPGIMVMFMLFVLSSLTMTYLDPVLSGWMVDTFSITTSTVGLIFVSWSAAYAIVSPLIGKLVDKGYVFSIMLLGVFSSAIIFLFMAPSPLLDFIFHKQTYLWMVVVVCVLEGISGALLYIPCYQAAINIAGVNGYKQNVQTYGLVSGMMNSGYALGSLAGPLLSGYLTDKYTFKWATTVMTFVLMGMGVVLALYVTIMKMTGRPLSLPPEQETKPLLSSPINQS